MPAKPLTPEELADAARLKSLFHAWQKTRKDKGEPASQEAVSEILDFGQSAISQYLNGGIPLNVDAAFRFAEMLGQPISAFSPTLADQAAKYAAAAYGQVATHQLGGALDLSCETREEVAVLAAYRLASNRGDSSARRAYDALTAEFLARVAAERKKL